MLARKRFAIGFLKACLALGLIALGCPAWAAATVDAAITNQFIHGFGASSAWCNSSTLATAAQAIWADDWVDGHAGLSILRTRIDPTGSFASEAANMTLAKGVNPNILIWSTEWTPPAAYKNNNSVNGPGTNNTFNNTAANSTAYANYLINYIQTIKNSYGVDLYAVSPQNEPDWNTSYESCLWTAAQFQDFVKNYLGPGIKNAGLATKIMIPESFSDNLAMAAATMNDAVAAPMVGIIGNHLYGGGPNALSSGGFSYLSNQENWETEISDVSGATHDPSMTPALQIAGWVHNCMVNASMNAFLSWWIYSYTNDDSGLYGSSLSTPTKKIYALGNYSKFVRPGWYRMGGSISGASGVNISAYKNAQGVPSAFCIVAVNTTSAAVNQTFSLANLNCVSVTPWVTDANNNLAHQAGVAVASNSFSYSLPAQSLVSFYGLNQVASPSPTNTSTSSPSSTPSRTRTPSSSCTPSASPSPSPSITPSGTSTHTHTLSPSPTGSNTFTATLTQAKSSSPSPPPSATATASITLTRSSTPSATSSSTPSNSPTTSGSPSRTLTLSPSPTLSSSSSSTPSFSPTLSTITSSPTPTLSPSFRPSPSTMPSSPSPTATLSFILTTASPTPTTSPQSSALSTATTSSTITLTLTRSPTSSPTPTPSASLPQTPSPTTTGSASPSHSPSPSVTSSFTLPTPSLIPTPSTQISATSTFTPSPSAISSSVPSNTITLTLNPSSTSSPTPTWSPSPSSTPSLSFSPSPSAQHSLLSTLSSTPTVSLSPTLSPSPSPSPTATSSLILPSPSFTPSPPPSPLSTATPSPSLGTQNSAASIAILDLVPVPNPQRGPLLGYAIKLQGQASSLTLKIYSSAWLRVGQYQARGSFGPGWTLAQFQTQYLAAGTYYYLLQAESPNGTLAQSKPGPLFISR